MPCPIITFVTSTLLPVPQVHHTLVHILFSVTFSLSLTMFELIIFEIAGILDTK